MATISLTLASLAGFVGDNVRIVTWTPLTQTGSDVGEAFQMPGWGDRSVQVFGTFGVAGNCRIQGSMDGTNWGTLTDPQGNALDFTAAKIEAITERVRYIRPSITLGDGTTSLTVMLLAANGAPS